MQKFQLSISYVPQNFYIIDGTIIENIAFGKDPNNYNFERALWAAEVAELQAIIKDNPDNLYKRVGENGINISGGQKQRLALARAIYKGSDFLILDEATSALDLNTESKILKNIEKLNKTIFIVSHRPYSLDLCDKIFKFENGQIII